MSDRGMELVFKKIGVWPAGGSARVSATGVSDPETVMISQ